MGLSELENCLALVSADQSRRRPPSAGQGLNPGGHFVDLQYLIQRLNEELRVINRAIVELERQPARPSAELRLLRHRPFRHRRTRLQRTESAKEERSC
jgi:hypothetical protein